MIRFWMVLCVSGQGNPAVKHYLIESAEDEAKRLAAKHPGQTFVILEAVCNYKTDIPEATKEKTVSHPGLDLIGLTVEVELGEVEWDPFSEGGSCISQGVVTGIDPRTGMMVIESPGNRTERVDYRRLVLANKEVSK